MIKIPVSNKTADAIDAEERTAVDRLLLHDLLAFAAKLGLAPAPTLLGDADAVRLGNLAERYSRAYGDEERQSRCLLICGLLWEHRRERWTALPGFLVNLLSRLGLGPSMRMVDEQYDRDSGSYSPLGSASIEAAVVARSLEHEVVVADNVTVLLSRFQKEVWDAIDENTRLGISAPTSAGKSFVLVHKIVDLLSTESGTVVYIVPTLSLIQQVTRDLKETAAHCGVEIGVYQTYIPAANEQSPSRVFVLTQERALSALAQPGSFVSLRMLVVDEVQNIERVSDQGDERARTLFDVIQEFDSTRHPRKVVISGPRVENIAQLTKVLFTDAGEAIPESLPPVVNLSYAFSLRNKRVLLRQYSPVNDYPQEIEVSLPAAVARAVFGGQQYGEPTLNFIADIVDGLNEHNGTLVFSPTSDQATKTALALASRRERSSSGQLQDLQAYVAETVHPNYALASCVRHAIGYHHGKVPHHIRIAVEQAFSSLEINTLACTTTLMQGVNLPAKNIIARNPNLYVRRPSGRAGAQLTAYEFANLRGRAGRLLKDFVGRAIILDEGAFEQTDIGFDFPSTEVNAGYRDRFEGNREEIIDTLIAGRDASVDIADLDLVIYIRQAILRHGSDSLRRLARAGITITDAEYSTTQRQLDRLSVPQDVCTRSPYWDPLVLDELFKMQEWGGLPELPSSPMTSGFVDALLICLDRLRDVIPYYYDKHLGIDNPSTLRSLAITAQNWSTGQPLHTIISWGKDGDRLGWSDIDRRLDLVFKTVMYDLPKLLQPLVSIQRPDNPLLGFMELGAFDPQVRRLIELGLPRETALRTSRLSGMRQLRNSEVNDLQLISRVAEHLRELTYWERLQVREVLVPDALLV